MRSAVHSVMRGIVWAMPVLAYAALAPTAFAAYISPSGPVYPGAPYSVNEDISNSGSSAITVTNDWYYRINGGGWNAWCHQTNSVPANGSITVSCGSTGDVAGTVMEFQVNTWRPDYSGSDSWSNTGFTVQSPPATASASLSPSGDVYPNTTLSLSGSVSGSGYTGTNCWAYSINGGARSCWFSPGSSTGDFSYSWSAGAADPSTTYMFYLCTDNGAGDCATAGTLRVVNPSSYTLSTSVSSGSGSVLCNGGSCASAYPSGTSVSLSASPSSGYSFSGWGGDCSGTGSCSLTVDSNKSITASFSAVQNVLAVVTRLDGGQYSNITISEISGTPAPNWAGGSTYASGPGDATYLRSTTSDINLILLAPFSLGSNIFYSWSGDCSNVSGTQCTVTASGGQSKTVIANYLSPAQQPNLTVSLQTMGATMAGSNQYLAYNLDRNVLRPELWYVATVNNAGATAAANAFDVNFSIVDASTGQPVQYPAGGGTVAGGLAAGASKKVASAYGLSAGTYLITACVDGGNNVAGGGSVVESNEGDNCTSQRVTLSDEPPPNPTPPCSASFMTDSSIDSSRNWSFTTHGSVNGCDASRFDNLNVSSSISLDDFDGPHPIRIFDPTYNGGQYNYDFSCNNLDYKKDMQQWGGNAIYGANSVADCTGGGWGATATAHLVFGQNIPVGGGSFSGSNKSDFKPYISAYNYFRQALLPWGNYNVNITDTFVGNYKCTLGGTQTVYHPECDPKNINYQGFACSGTAGAAPYTTTETVPPTYAATDRLGHSFSTDVPLRVCADEPQGDLSDARYYDSECVPVNPNATAGGYADCGDYKVPIGVTTPAPPPPPPPPSITRPDFTHYLTVKSTQDGAASGGLVVTQSSGSPTGMGGTTDSATAQYARTSVTNMDIWLTAPNKHSMTGNNFKGWDAYNATTNSGCDEISANKLDCHIILTFDTSGGKTRTVTANYTGKLDAPVITTSTAQCDAVGGKVNVTLQSAVSGATGYKLYRGTSPGNETTLVKDFTSATAPISGSANAPYVDGSALTPGTNYYYKMTAYNNLVTSPASLEISRAASLPCPDLIVEPGSVQIIDTASPPNVLDPTAVPSGTSIKFRAKIRNQNGAIVPPPTSFDNQFSLDGNTTDSFARNSVTPLNYSDVSPLSQFITSVTAPTTLGIGGHSLQVCADVPLHNGQVHEDNATGNAEDNNCLPIAFPFSVVNLITVKLECEKAGGVFDQNYCVIDYANTSNLRWTVTGNPSTCAASTGTDWTGAKSNQSYTVSGNPFSLTNLLNKLSFKYQLDCTR